MDSSTEAVQQSLMKLLAVVDRLDARNLQTVQRLEAATAAMEQGVGRLDRGGEQFAQQALQRIGADTQQTMAQGAGRAVTEFQHQLQQAAHCVQWAVQAMDEQRKGLAAARRSLVWIGAMVLLVGSLLAAGGAAWVAHRSMQEIAQANFGKDILQATQGGAITRCGDSLCVRVGKKPQHYGKEGEYVLLQNPGAR
jgi:hypothetical protein